METRRPSLTTAGLVETVWILSLVVLLLGGVFYWHEGALRRRALETQASLAARWADTLLEAGQEPSQVAAELLTGPPVVAVRLVDAAGEETASAGEDAPGLLQVQAPLRKGGSLVLGLNGPAVRRLPEFLAVWGLAWLLALLLGGLAARRFWRRAVQHPWREVVEVAEGLAGGELGRRLSPGEWAESARLATAMNAWAGTCTVLVEGVGSRVARLRGGTNRLAAGLEVASGQGEQLVVAMEDLAARLADQAGEPATGGADARELVEEVAALARETRQAWRELEAARKQLDSLEGTLRGLEALAGQFGTREGTQSGLTG